MNKKIWCDVGERNRGSWLLSIYFQKWCDEFMNSIHITDTAGKIKLMEVPGGLNTTQFLMMRSLRGNGTQSIYKRWIW